MNAIPTLKAQHDMLAAVMLRLVNLADGLDEPARAHAVNLELSRLSGLLRVHLALEDEWLYPSLAASADPAAISLAAICVDEVGGLAGAVEAFIAQWNSSTVIALDFKRFGSELRKLFHQIEDRIGLEEHDLYPLATRLGIGQPPLAA